MNDTRPVGVFDSGVGGLTVVRQMWKILPMESIVYFGDTARVPYGTKSKETVTKFSVENIEFLMRHDVKLVIVACNTASALSLDFLKRCFKVPVMGVIEPGAKGAIASTRSRRIGVIGTQATISSGSYEKMVKKICPEVFVFTQSCPLFVPLVEEGWTDGKVARDVTYEYLQPLRRKNIDTLILGCTHYPLLKKVIGSVMGRAVKLIDSSEEVANEARGILDANGLLRASGSRPTYKFFVSDEPRRFVNIGERFLKKRMGCVKRA